MEQIIIKPEMIILKGITTQATLGKKYYIIYKDKNNVMITGSSCEFTVHDNNIIITSTFTRKLAESLEDFYLISMDKIENQAYGAYMDGEHF